MVEKMPDGVVFLPSFHDAIKDLPDEERLGAYDAVIRYGLYGEVVEMTPHIKSLFVLMKPIIDSSQNRYRAAKENGRKGGRPPKNQTDNQTDNQDREKDMNYDSEKEKGYDYAREKEKEEESLRGGGRTVYKPPTEDAFEKMREQGLRKLGR